ncbi:hypothetical protein SAMN06297164_3533 [Nitrosomonas ureae]|uniref:Uncharacterized protein n=1 Tax=Nitrosomonas ureae TaxID=44577 RepID=A0A286AL52_9PROT|nr:hypothetical protein SAMN06297164_3533 [Nitrosomonas ureae]
MSLRLVMNTHHFQPRDIDAVPLLSLQFFLGLQAHACT